MEYRDENSNPVRTVYLEYQRPAQNVKLTVLCTLARQCLALLDTLIMFLIIVCFRQW